MSVKREKRAVGRGRNMSVKREKRAEEGGGGVRIYRKLQFFVQNTFFHL